MANIKTEIRDQGVMAAFDRLIALGEDPAPALDAVGRVLKTKVLLGFTTSTDPYGRPWAPLRARQGQPLRDRGHLMGSIDYRVEGNSVEIGTNIEYAPVHQFGATIEARNARALRFFVEGRPVFVGRGHKVVIPARPIFPLDGLPPDWSDDAQAAIADVIGSAWRGG